MDRSEFTADLNGKEERNFPNEEIVNTITTTAESFWEVEDTLNNLFDNAIKTKLQLHDDWKVLQKNLNELMVKSENVQVDPTKDTTQDHKIKQYENEISEYKMEIHSLKERLKRSEDLNQNLKIKLEQLSREKEQKEDADDSDRSLETWVKVDKGTSNDSNTEEKTNAGKGFDKTQLEKKVDEAISYTEKQFQDVIQMMNDFHEKQWIQTNISLMEGGNFKSDKIYNILFYTFWEAYQLTCRMLDGQLKKLSEDLYLPISNASKLPVPMDTENLLRELILKFKPEEKDRIIKEDLIKHFSPESATHIVMNSQFMMYIDKGLYLIRQMLLKHRNWFFKAHKIGEELDKECFGIYQGPSENCIVKKMIFPVLFSLQDGKIVILRKGMVITTSKQ